MQPKYSTTSYRYPNEGLILALTLVLVVLVIALTAAATVCLSFLFVLGMVAYSLNFSSSLRRALAARGQKVTPRSTPGLAALAAENASRLQVEPVDIYLAPNPQPNAYAFGLDTPKTIVLHSALLQIMDRDELQFILGHEMGHVRLGHTWLNTVVGGLAGIPSRSEASLVLAMAFRWWNRACEYSADRAGLLACGKPEKAISALVKLGAGFLEGGFQAGGFQAGGDVRTPSGMQRALRRIEAEDDDWSDNLNELLATHPMIVRRIGQIRSYAASPAFKLTKARMDRNVASG